MTVSRPDSLVDVKRVYLVMGCFAFIILLLIGRLWFLQVLKGSEFSVASERNRFREVMTPAPRGLVFDRNGQIMLANRPFFDLVIIPQYLQNRENTLKVMAELFQIPLVQIEKRLKEAARLPKFVPVRIKRNLSIHEVALVESNKFFLPGVDIDTAPRRDYDRNDSAHLMGYLGEVTTRELDSLNSQSRDFQYRVGMNIGKMGVEKKYESYLRGNEGKDFLQVDAYGRLQSRGSLDFGLFQRLPASRGADIYLTIDRDIQEAAIEAFRNKNGAIVALNAQTGQVLAYVSNPNFSLSLYQDGLSQEDWQGLQTNPFKPLLDKVTGGAYPPGSTFKIVTAVAALEENVVTPQRTFFCNGSFTLGNGRWRCWKKGGHGWVDMHKALEQSCDTYFYQMGNLLGIERLSKWARAFGLGEKSELGLNMELTGINPNAEWKLKTAGQGWATGDTINISIGQGYVLMTPLQVANMFAALGNGGRLYRPSLLNKVVDERGVALLTDAPHLRRTIVMRKSTLDVVKQALHDVVHSPTGTGKKAFIPGVTVSGKTGTAQNASLKRVKGQEQDIAFRKLDHAWFAAFSPSDEPEIAVVALSEFDGGGGGAQAAPIVQQVIKAYWRKKDPQKLLEQEKKGAQESAPHQGGATVPTQEAPHD